MSFSNDNDRDLWIYSKVGTSLCKSVFSTSTLRAESQCVLFSNGSSAKRVNKTQDVAIKFAYLGQALA